MNKKKNKSCWLEVRWQISPAYEGAQEFAKFNDAVEFAIEQKKKYETVAIYACYSNGYTHKIEERFCGGR